MNPFIPQIKLKLLGSVCLFITYPGVASLLKFLCNGLVRRHDHKHLDSHVEDGHGDQVGHIISVGNKKHIQL